MCIALCPVRIVFEMTLHSRAGARIAHKQTELKINSIIVASCIMSTFVFVIVFCFVVRIERSVANIDIHKKRRKRKTAKKQPVMKARF